MKTSRVHIGIYSYEHNIYPTAEHCVIKKPTLTKLHHNKSWAETENFSYGLRVEMSIIECNDSESLKKITNFAVYKHVTLMKILIRRKQTQK